MKTKKVNRYYCDHCGKGGGAAGHMRRHEERCTLNPQRVCGMCRFDKRAPKPLAELVAMLPDPEKYKKCDDHVNLDCDSYIGLVEAAKTAWPALKEAADECPACMLAAVRQAGMPDGFLSSCDFFNYRKAVDSLFAEHRYEEQEACSHG